MALRRDPNRYGASFGLPLMLLEKLHILVMAAPLVFILLFEVDKLTDAAIWITPFWIVPGLGLIVAALLTAVLSFRESYPED